MTDAKNGHVAVIGLGPGNAAQVTPEASERSRRRNGSTATDPMSTGWS